MFVRTACAQDLPAVRALLVETWHETYDAIYGAEKVTRITDEWHSLAALKARIERIDSEFLLADDGEQIAGMAFASGTDGGSTIQLRQLYVRPARQGRGVGGLLLDEVLSSFPEARKIRLEVEEANTNAVAFYVAHGFSRVGVTPHCGKPDSDIPAAIYERAL
ncbi:GNAT family N-acetyltransferase [Nitratireductor sp. GCM10026969]|uniref:GNAT family N-acetyltransferase n=1 Tax=Nitratireductor sp. GCM10026969 TaxID=3252645 RepID=UPI00361F4BB4